MSDMDRTPKEMREDALMWRRAGFPEVACGRYRDAADQIERLQTALHVIASGTICPDLFPDAVRTEQDYELAAKTAMVTAIAALNRGAEHD